MFTMKIDEIRALPAETYVEAARRRQLFDAAVEAEIDGRLQSDLQVRAGRPGGLFGQLRAELDRTECAIKRGASAERIRFLWTFFVGSVNNIYAPRFGGAPMDHENR